MAFNVHIDLQRRATRALIKFITDHDGEVDLNLQKCMEALGEGNVELAVSHARYVKPSGMGGLADWLPPVKFPHEDGEYVWAVLEALVGQWCHAMSLSMPKRG